MSLTNLSPRTPALAAAFAAFVAWLLLLLVTVSTPINKSIYIAQIDAHAQAGIGPFDVAQVDGSVRFGVYGYCISAIHASGLGGHLSHDVPAECSERKLGYSFDSKVLDALHIGNLEDDLSTTLTFGLATHLVAAVLAFVTLLAALWSAARVPVKVAAIAALASSLLAVLFALIAFIFDAVFAGMSRRILRKVTDSVSVSIGNATWLTMTAFILLLVAALSSAFAWRSAAGNTRRPLSEKTGQNCA